MTILVLITYSRDESVEFVDVSLGPVVLHVAPDSDEGGETEDEEDRAREQVEEERRQDEPAQILRVPQTHEADAGKNVAYERRRKKNVLKVFVSRAPNALRLQTLC